MFVLQREVVGRPTVGRGGAKGLPAADGSEAPENRWAEADKLVHLQVEAPLSRVAGRPARTRHAARDDRPSLAIPTIGLAVPQKALTWQVRLPTSHL